MDDISLNLALNVRQLRSARQLSQVQLAQIAGIPRPTLAHLESGSANPTLSVLMRIASALQVLIEELIAPPRSRVRHICAEELPQRQRGQATVRHVLPDSLRGLSLERMTVPAGALVDGMPHARGTQKYVICEAGCLDVGVGEEVIALEPGDVAVFRGDQRHRFENRGATSAFCYGLVTAAPVPG